MISGIIILFLIPLISLLLFGIEAVQQRLINCELGVFKMSILMRPICLNRKYYLKLATISAVYWRYP